MKPCAPTFVPPKEAVLLPHRTNHVVTVLSCLLLSLFYHFSLMARFGRVPLQERHKPSRAVKWPSWLIGESQLSPCPIMTVNRARLLHQSLGFKTDLKMGLIWGFQSVRNEELMQFVETTILASLLSEDA